MKEHCIKLVNAYHTPEHDDLWAEETTNEIQLKNA